MLNIQKIMFHLVKEFLEIPVFKEFLNSKKTKCPFKDYTREDFGSLIELWCIDEISDGFNYLVELENLKIIYGFKQNPIFIEGVPDEKIIRKMLENVYRSIIECSLIDKSKHEKFLYDFCTLNCEELNKHNLQDEDYVKIAFALMFGENKLYYNLTYLSLVSSLCPDEIVIKKITDAMQFIHYYTFCLEDDNDFDEIISVGIDENNGSVSLQQFSFE